RRLVAGRRQRAVRALQVLAQLYWLGSQHGDPFYPHPAGALRALAGSGVQASLRELAARNWVRRLPDGRVALTPEGLAAVSDFLQQAAPDTPVPPSSESKPEAGP
ncbi:MAG: hypothetical protein C4316_03765, partial [Chloroflexota bacterium]